MDSGDSGENDPLLRAIARAADLDPPHDELRDFPSDDRYEIVRRVGAGGMGIVYEAFDRELHQRVAFKTLLRLEPSALYRFKKEFRSLADLHHPNLVQLYELSARNGRWFFTMELIDGVDFLAHVRPANRTEVPLAPPLALDDTIPASEPRPAVRNWDTAPSLATEAEARLRSALRQLVAGVRALHAAGTIHRDIKPSNILVERGGRVALLDFGIATSVKPAEEGRTETGSVMGTPAYMAPEQVRGGPLTEAVDWYAVGVTLFEALTGRLPFQGEPLQALLAKQGDIAPRVSSLAPTTPPDLDDLCAALLEKDPSARPTGDTIAATLGSPEASVHPISQPLSTKVFVGRHGQLGALLDATKKVRGGRAVRVHVEGRSGMGKSALVDRFFRGLRERHQDTIVLAGRCYERESVPYKAFDALVDSLTSQLLRLPHSTAEALVPRDAQALSRVFPVLQRVPALASAPRRNFDQGDPQQLRARAFGALRELLGRLADRMTLVLFIDDLQWGDEDSAALLRELTAPPDPPSMLTLLVYRSEDVARSSTLRTLLRVDDRTELVTVSVQPLSPGDSLDLARALLETASDDPRVAMIADESNGSPFFLGELARLAQADGPGAPQGPLRIERIIADRLHALPDDARRLLEVIAVAGVALRHGVAGQAAAESAERSAAALATLRVQHLTRAGSHEGTSECAHDRIREYVVESLLEARLAEIHSAIADALHSAGDADPEQLHTHYLAAGRIEAAVEQAEAAAASARSLFAFDRAAHLYGVAIDLGKSQTTRLRGLRLQLADALVGAGRGAEAADVFLTVARDAATPERLELQSAAAQQLLFTGHIDRGIEMIRLVLSQEGIHLARSPIRALPILLFLRAWLWIRGHGFRARKADDLSPERLRRVDLLSSVGTVLGLNDFVRGAALQSRGLLEALSLGEPHRVARALAAEAGFQAADGHGATERVEAMLAQARALGGSEDRRLAAWFDLMSSMVADLTGRWILCSEFADSAASNYEQSLNRTGRFRFELGIAQAWGLIGLYMGGRLTEAARRHAVCLREAAARNDLQVTTLLSTGPFVFERLRDDDPVAARARSDLAMTHWSQRKFHTQHHFYEAGLADVELYEGHASSAYERMRKLRRNVRRSLLNRMELIRAINASLFGRAALALALMHARPRHLLAQVASECHWLESRAAPWCVGLAAALRAGIKHLRGDDAEAARHLRTALETFQAVPMKMHSAAVSQRLGALIGGDEGRDLVASGIAAMTEEGVRVPARWTRMLVPGFSD